MFSFCSEGSTMQRRWLSLLVDFIILSSILVGYLLFTHIQRRLQEKRKLNRKERHTRWEVDNAVPLNVLDVQPASQTLAQKDFTLDLECRNIHLEISGKKILSNVNA